MLAPHSELNGWNYDLNGQSCYESGLNLIRFGEDVSALKRMFLKMYHS